MDEEDIDMGVEDVDIEGSDPISKLLDEIPPCRGKKNVPKEIDENKVTLHTPLLPENIVFDGPRLRCVPHLKLEDWDFTDMERFPHLGT